MTRFTKLSKTFVNRQGVSVRYTTVLNDQLDGELWARSSGQNLAIEMPDSDCFEQQEQAILVLGHELAHLVSRIDSSDNPVESVKNEAACDLLGSYFYNLAEMIAAHKAEQQFLTAAEAANK